MKTELIIAALRSWSPNGLCTGKLVLENGEREKTQACSAGCLALEFLARPEGEAWLKKYSQEKGLFIKTWLYDTAGFDNVDVGDRENDEEGEFERYVDTLEDNVCAFFGLAPIDVNAIIGFNDDCIETVTGAKVLDVFLDPKYAFMPEELRTEIVQLRQKHEAWVESMAKAGVGVRED